MSRLQTSALLRPIWIGCALDAGALALPIVLRVYTLWWDLVWGAGTLLEFLLPRA